MLATAPIVVSTPEAPGLVAAFIAGMLSFASPCVLPLVPSYIAYITGTATAEPNDEIPLRALTIGLAFVAGFSLIFIALGASASALGSALALRSDAFARVGGVLIIMFGLTLLGLLRIPGAQRDTRMMHRIVLGRASSHMTAVLVGAGFAAGWSPCIGPVLASILTVAATSGVVGHGTALLAAYAAGLAVPFIAASLAIDRTIILSQRMRPILPHINRICGLLLVGIGILMITGTMPRLSAWAARFTPAWLA